MNSYTGAPSWVPAFQKHTHFWHYEPCWFSPWSPSLKGNSCGQEASTTLYKRVVATTETPSAWVLHVFRVLPVIHREAVVLNGLGWREVGRENPVRFRSLSGVWGGMVQRWHGSAGWRWWVGGPHSHLWFLIIGTISKAREKQGRLLFPKKEEKPNP